MRIRFATILNHILIYLDCVIHSPILAKSIYHR
uniref:Uncharacterized protein n=1 Tax=Arundo donax TaxID=35708 RepID=A0A0A9D487_ARUDO